MSYYIGTGPADVINSFIKRYFYGMRRNDDGEMFLLKSDQQKAEKMQLQLTKLEKQLKSPISKRVLIT